MHQIFLPSVSAYFLIWKIMAQSHESISFWAEQHSACELIWAIVLVRPCRPHQGIKWAQQKLWLPQVYTRPQWALPSPKYYHYVLSASVWGKKSQKICPSISKQQYFLQITWKVICTGSFFCKEIWNTEVLTLSISRRYCHPLHLSECLGISWEILRKAGYKGIHCNKNNCKESALWFLGLTTCQSAKPITLPNIWHPSICPSIRLSVTRDSTNWDHWLIPSISSLLDFIGERLNFLINQWDR